jgi:pimeloyl-ACP methyl ester carboxylesterase
LHRVYLMHVNDFSGDDLHAKIADAKRGKPAIVGHSMDGLVALMLAKVHPDNVGKLMIVDSLPYIGEIFSSGATMAALEPQAKAMCAGMAAAYGKPANPAANEALAARMALKPAPRASVADSAAKRTRVSPRRRCTRT